MNNRRVKVIINEMVNEYCQRNNERELTDISVSVGESSTIKAEARPYFKKHYREKIKPLYQAEFNRQGGTDSILANLVTQVREKIAQLTETPGLSVEALAAIKEQKWKYTVVIRALTQPHTISYKSVLHDPGPHGVQPIYDEVNLRELLAYYWLTASDPQLGTQTAPFTDSWEEALQLELAEIQQREGSAFNAQLQREKLRKYYLEKSIENFLDTIFEIRRAHNEGALELILDRDNPSCQGGTFGRIIQKSSVHHSLTAIQPIPPRLIQKEIQKFIIQQLATVDIDVMNAIYRYLDSKLMLEAVNPLDERIFDEFVESCKVQQKQNELILFLNNNIKKLKLQLGDIRTKERIRTIFQLEMENISQKDGNTPEQNFCGHLFRILEQRRENLIVTASEKILSNPAIRQLRIGIKQLEISIKALERAILNETFRSVLLPDYSQDDMAKFKIQQFKERLNHQYIPQLKAMTDLLTERSNEVFKSIQHTDDKIREKIFDDILKRANALGALTTKLNKQTSLLTNLTNQANTAKVLRDLDKELPLPADEEKNYSFLVSKPGQWANLLLRLAFERDDKNVLIQDEHEVSRLLELMKNKFKASSPAEYKDFLSLVIRIINDKFAAYHEQSTPSFWKIKNIALKILSTAFTQLDETNKADPKLVSLYAQNNYSAKLNNPFEQINFDSFSRDFALTFTNKAAELDLCASKKIVFCEVNVKSDPRGNVLKTEKIDNPEYKINQAAWLSTACSLFSEENLNATIPYTEKNGVDALYKFILLTVFKNLSLTDIKESDAKTIYWLCQSYLSLPTDEDANGSKYSPFSHKLNANNTIRERIDLLMQHLSCLLTSLYPLSVLFNTGHIRIMSMNSAEAALNSSNVMNGIIFRVSNSAPQMLAESYREGSIIKHSYIKTGIYSFAMNGISFFVATPDVLRAKLRNRKFITGIIPIYDALSDGYAEETKQEHKKNARSAQTNYAMYNGPDISVASESKQLSQACYVAWGGNQHLIYGAGLAAQNNMNQASLAEIKEPLAQWTQIPAISLQLPPVAQLPSKQPIAQAPSVTMVSVNNLTPTANRALPINNQPPLRPITLPVAPSAEPISNQHIAASLVLPVHNETPLRPIIQNISPPSAPITNQHIAATPVLPVHNETPLRPIMQNISPPSAPISIQHIAATPVLPVHNETPLRPINQNISPPSDPISNQHIAATPILPVHNELPLGPIIQNITPPSAPISNQHIAATPVLPVHNEPPLRPIMQNISPPSAPISNQHIAVNTPLLVNLPAPRPIPRQPRAAVRNTILRISGSDPRREMNLAAKDACAELNTLTSDYYTYLSKQIEDRLVYLCNQSKQPLDLYQRLETFHRILQSPLSTLNDFEKKLKSDDVLTERYSKLAVVKKLITQVSFEQSNRAVNYRRQLLVFRNELKSNFLILAHHKTSWFTRFLYNVISVFSIIGIPLRIHHSPTYAFWKSKGEQMMNKMKNVIQQNEEATGVSFKSSTSANSA